MLAPDTILQGRYRIIRQLGEGGMGAVYEAIDERLDATVALKETFFTDERLRKQFEREARLMARLHHPALPRVSDHFTENEGQFLVMQFIPGEDLWGMLEKRGGAFPVNEVLTWADQLLDALDYLHTQEPRIIHRDIKPQNLKLTGRGQIILLDFGLAKGFAGQISRVTTSGSIFGYTPNYAPLEQIQGTGTNERSDLYSLGATLYHLMTGAIPPDALSRATAIMSEQADPLRPANEINSAVPVSVADVLHQAMANNPARRPISAAEMRRLLNDAVQEQAPAKSELRETMLPPTVFSSAPAQSAQEPESAAISPTIAAVARGQENLSDVQQLQLEYWTAFRDFLLQSNSFLKSQKPQAQTWFPITIGRSNFRLVAYTQRRERKICVYLVLSGPDAKPHYYLLERDKEAIRHDIGEDLEWEERLTQEQSYIFICKDKTDPENRQDWEAQHEWLKEKLELFHRVFAPRVKTLNVGDYVSDEESEVKPARVDSTVGAATIASVTTSSENLTESQKLHLEYWTKFGESLKRRSSSIVMKKPALLYSINFFPFGRSRVKLSAYAHERDKWIGVGLVLYGSDAKPHFHLLHQQKEDIEKEIGASLEWKERPKGKESYIYLRRNNKDPNNRQDWPNQHEWLCEKLEIFHKVFASRIERLDVSNYSKDKIAPTPSSIENPALLQEPTPTLASLIVSPTPTSNTTSTFAPVNGSIKDAQATEPTLSSPILSSDSASSPIPQVSTSSDTYKQSNRPVWFAIIGIITFLILTIVLLNLIPNQSRTSEKHSNPLNGNSNEWNSKISSNSPSNLNKSPDAKLEQQSSQNTNSNQSNTGQEKPTKVKLRLLPVWINGAGRGLISPQNSATVITSEGSFTKKVGASYPSYLQYDDISCGEKVRIEVSAPEFGYKSPKSYIRNIPCGKPIVNLGQLSVNPEEQ